MCLGQQDSRRCRADKEEGTLHSGCSPNLQREARTELGRSYVGGSDGLPWGGLGLCTEVTLSLP